MSQITFTIWLTLFCSCLRQNPHYIMFKKCLDDPKFKHKCSRSYQCLVNSVLDHSSTCAALQFVSLFGVHRFGSCKHWYIDLLQSSPDCKRIKFDSIAEVPLNTVAKPQQNWRNNLNRFTKLLHVLWKYVESILERVLWAWLKEGMTERCKDLEVSLM